MSAPLRLIGSNETIRLSCGEGEFLLWLRPSASWRGEVGQSGWAICGIWEMLDGDAITITNRAEDLPAWLEVSTSDVCDIPALKMNQRLTANYRPTEQTKASAIWRGRTGDRLIAGSTLDVERPVREIIELKACMIVSGESAQMPINDCWEFGAPDGNRMSDVASNAMSAAFQAAISLGVPAEVAREWKFGL
jgi:hypothetical protein